MRERGIWVIVVRGRCGEGFVWRGVWERGMMGACSLQGGVGAAALVEVPPPPGPWRGGRGAQLEREEGAAGRRGSLSISAAADRARMN